MEARTAQRERIRPPGGRLHRFVHSLLATALVVALLYLAGSLLLDRHLNHEIRDFLQRLFAERYPDLVVEIHSVRRVENKGVEVRGLTIAEPGQPPTVQVDELLIHCSTALADLAHRQPKVQHITVRRLRLRAVHRADGSWNVSGLWPPPQCGSRPVPATVEDAVIELRDADAAPSQHLVLRGVQLASLPTDVERVSDTSGVSSRTVTRIRGQAEGDYFQKFAFEGTQDPDQKAWSVRGSLLGLEFSERSLEGLPRDWLAKVAPLAALQARGDFQFDLSSQPAEGFPITFAIDGKLTDGRLSDARLPSPLSDLRANLHCDNRGVRITEFAAREGDATLQLSAQVLGYTEKSPLYVRAIARQLSLDHRLLEVLPEAAKAQWNKFLPTGVADVDLAVTFDGERWDPELHVVAHDMSVTYYRFPYRIQGVQGSIRLKDGVLRSENLHGEINGQTGRIELEIQNPGPDWTGCLQLSVADPVSLDDAMLNALAVNFESVAKVIRELDPRGQLTLWGRFQRDDPQESPKKELHLGIRDGSIKYRKFPYPLDEIRGTMSMAEGRWTFDRLTARNDNARVTCEGSWTPRADGSHLVLNFAATDVPLEDQLRQALPPASRDAWSSLRPSGTLDQLFVVVQYDTPGKVLDVDVMTRKRPAKQNPDGEALTLHPKFFPLRFEDVTGEARFHGGVIELRNLRAMHGRTEVRTGGQCTLANDGGWTMDFARVTADRLVVDHEFLTALPERLGQGLGKLNLRGPVNVDGSFRLGRDDRNSPVRSQWDVQLDVENADFDPGLKLEHIRGGVRLFGQFDGRQFHSQGELNLDTVHHRHLQFTRVKGPLWIDESRVAFGAWAEPQGKRSPRKLTADAFGGAVQLNAQVAAGDDNRYTLEASLLGADMAVVTAELTSQRKTLSGRLFGNVQLTGTNKGTHTLRGKGAVQLRDADIYQAPLMVALLNVLKLKPPDSAAFTTSNAEFRIQGEHVYLDRLDFSGDALTLKGNGDVNLNGALNLNFYTMVGPDDPRSSLVRNLFRAASQQFLLIHVGGTLEQPDLQRRAFPGLEETFQQIFPEADRRDAKGNRPATQ